MVMHRVQTRHSLLVLLCRCPHGLEPSLRHRQLLLVLLQRALGVAQLVQLRQDGARRVAVPTREETWV